jgi:hydrogenase expression/formation protein HypC
MCLAIPARIVEISPEQPHSAMVEVMGVRRRVDLALLEDDPPHADDWILIHVGFALSKISERDALEQLETLRALGETEAALGEISSRDDGKEKAS